MIFKKNRKILFEKFKNQTLAFDLSTNLPYVLNNVAAFILINTDGRKSLAAIAEENSASTEEASSNVAVYVDQIVELTEQIKVFDAMIKNFQDDLKKYHV